MLFQIKIIELLSKARKFNKMSTEITLEKYMEQNNQVLNNMNFMLKKVRDDAANKAIELVDVLKTEISIIKTDNDLLKNDLKETKSEIFEVKQNYNILKDATYVLATDDAKRKEFTRLLNSLIYSKYTGKKNSLKDKLFHQALAKTCYDRIYNQFEINSYTRVRIDDFDEAVKVVHRFFGNEQNIKKCISNRLKSYIEDKYLSKDKKKMVDEFLKLSDGGQNLWY